MSTLVGRKQTLRTSFKITLVLLAAALWLGGCASREPRVDASGTAAPTKPGGYYADDGPGEHPPLNLDSLPDAVPRVEVPHRYANQPYEVFGKRYVPAAFRVGARQRGLASWYGKKFHGKRTASGEIYDMYQMTAAHPTLPIPSYARVANVQNGRSVVVRVNDRGPFHSDRIMDLSYAAAYKLRYIGPGKAWVEVEALQPVPGNNVATGQSSVKLGVPGGAAHFVQLAVFSAAANAHNFHARVSAQLDWLRDALQIVAHAGSYRVHVGPYRDESQARGVAARIEHALALKPVLTRY